MHRTPSLLAGIALALSLGSVAAAELQVTVQGIQHERGNIRIVLYAGAEGFRKEESSHQVIELPANAGTVTASFNDLEPGEYAIIAYHDENTDGQLNRRFGMIPTEGYGLSNNPRVIGPPRFEDSAFRISPEGATQELTLNY